VSITVGYLSDEAIEAEAGALLAGYARKTGAAIRVPALLLDDLLQYLGLRFEMEDLRTRFGVPDVMGAIWIEDRFVRIDEMLDPDEQPAMRGRFYFTLAHETAHWVLHRGYVEPRRTTEEEPLGGPVVAPSIICRTGQRKARIEVQADIFASCLLMPRASLLRAWQRKIGPERLRLSDLRPRLAQLSVEATLRRGGFPGDPRGQQDEVVELVVRPLAEEFQVSPRAMRIRLERLGMIVRDVEATEPLLGAVPPGETLTHVANYFEAVLGRGTSTYRNGR
jgi:Zn-dependent peptidase ImmA (M78 family)